MWNQNLMTEDLILNCELSTRNINPSTILDGEIVRIRVKITLKIPKQGKI